MPDTFDPDTSDPDAFDLDAFTPYLLNVLASRTSARLAGAYEARFGITVAEWRVIAHLAQHGKVSVREIHERVDMDKSKVSRAAGRLQAARLVAKKVNAADRRLVELTLTRKGRRLFEDIVPLALGFERSLFDGFTADEEARFRGFVGRLLAGLPPRGADGVASGQATS